MALKVIGAGFGRTGTNSFQVAVETLGFAPCHHMNVVLSQPQDPDVWRRAAAGTLADWDELYAGFAATCDFPHCVFYKELADFYPEAKVVLTVRDPESWYRSISTTIMAPQMVQAMRRAAVAGGPVGELAGPIAKIIDRVLDMDRIQDKETSIAAFVRHNERVKAAIASERLLVYEAGDGWGPLCEFLGVPEPSEPYPVTNTTQEFLERRDEILSRVRDSGG